MSAFADILSTTTITLKSGETVDLRAELTAEETYRLFDLLREPAGPERGTKLLKVWVEGWSLAMRDGTRAPVTESSLGMLKLPIRLELDALVDAHMAEYIQAVIPDALREEAETSGNPPEAGPEDGAPASSESASRRTKRRT